MELAKHWRLKGARYRLEGVRNRTTGTIHFPPPARLDTDDEPIVLSGKGEIWSWSAVREGRAEWGGQYTLAMIKLVEGPLVTARLTDFDPERLQVGQPVEMVTRKLRDLGEEGLLVYGYMFRPLLDEQP